MQLYSFSRGLMRNQQRMFEEMSAQVFPFKYKDEKATFINWQVRPIQLVEYVFPKKELQMVLKSIPGISEHGFPQIVKKLIQKKLKLDPVPEIEKTGEKRLIYGDGVQNVLVGIKEDVDGDGYEML